ncbi:putative phage protein (TIGR02220 family) [Bacillus pakistanensis]|uniref:Phage protein (TIGR02220 family) n=1 Tax=Rossellomorea pakistanensis TaxID=992288 RepID=A0ABS2N7H1_9BACI|nr:conserved phage C-terminal domain-containing protein [Bacillus pakistanensis]MBM7583541.1 putative phage protein (TIGR02220 family) [Bacillus pakistanensis]
MSRLLINEHPLMVIPSLAVKVGVNESIFLQQIHYWLTTSSHVFEENKWIYNSYIEWQKQFPFWSISTIRRTINSLEKQGYVVSANWNRSKMDKTKWYRIDYEKLEGLEYHRLSLFDLPSAQSEQSKESGWTKDEISLNKPIPEITTETTTEKIHILFSEVIDYLNQQTHSSYKSNSKKTKQLIQARWREGFVLDDFKKVIDLKTSEWLRDPHWSKYLRPETLFGPKFESYVNQKANKKSYKEEDFNLDD